ncbi:MAG: hypothetical protein HW421_58 [Ignavibacteria bacterium]|nr:hypothetical protein [Ignavibacteria bacterium]
MKIFRFILIIILLFYLYNFKCYSQIKSNNEIIESLFEKFAQHLNLALVPTNGDSIILNITGSDAVSILKQKIITDSNLKKIIFIEKSSLKNPNQLVSISVILNNFGVEYLQDSTDTDKIIRKCFLTINANITNKEGLIRSLPNFSSFVIDTLFHWQIHAAESNAYPFARAPLPDKKGSMWNKIIEPVVIVASAAATVLIFFYVRSK